MTVRYARGELSPSPEQVEYAEVLLRRTKGDLQACRVLTDETDIDDSIVGFHAQQTVEKALKVALVLAGVELPHSHDLEFFVKLVREAEIELPAELVNIEWLTPWAANLRYDEPEALDRSAALSVAECAADWAASLLAEWSSTSDPQGSIQGSVLSKSDPGESETTPATTGDPTQLDPPWATS